MTPEETTARATEFDLRRQELLNKARGSLARVKALLTDDGAKDEALGITTTDRALSYIATMQQFRHEALCHLNEARLEQAQSDGSHGAEVSIEIKLILAESSLHSALWVRRVFEYVSNAHSKSWDPVGQIVRSQLSAGVEKDWAHYLGQTWLVAKPVFFLIRAILGR